MGLRFPLALALLLLVAATPARADPLLLAPLELHSVTQQAVAGQAESYHVFRDAASFGAFYAAATGRDAPVIDFGARMALVVTSPDAVCELGMTSATASGADAATVTRVQVQKQGALFGCASVHMYNMAVADVPQTPGIVVFQDTLTQQPYGVQAS